MKSTTKQGVIGALMDKYKYAINDLKAHVSDVKDEEQLMEHAIVHIYQHRRQIRKFKQLLEKSI